MNWNLKCTNPQKQFPRKRPSHFFEAKAAKDSNGHIAFRYRSSRKKWWIPFIFRQIYLHPALPTASLVSNDCVKDELNHKKGRMNKTNSWGNSLVCVLWVHLEVHGRGNTRASRWNKLLVSSEVLPRRPALETLHSNSDPTISGERACSERSYGFSIFFFLRFLSIEKVVLTSTYALSLTQLQYRLKLHIRLRHSIVRITMKLFFKGWKTW